MSYLLFVKKRQNLQMSSAANYRWRLKRKVRNTYPVQRAVRVPGIFASGIALLTMRPSLVRFRAMIANVLSTRVFFACVSHWLATGPEKMAAL